MIDKDANEFMDALAELINNSGLPPVVIRLALELARSRVVEIEESAVRSEREQEARALKEKEQ